MKRKKILIYMTLIAALVLFGCGGADEEDVALSHGEELEEASEEIGFIKRENTSKEDTYEENLDEETVKDAADAYIGKDLLGIGMQCVDEMIYRLEIDVERDRNVNGREELVESWEAEIQSMVNMEAASAVLIPYKAEEAFKVIAESDGFKESPEEMKEQEYRKDYLLPSTMVRNILTHSSLTSIPGIQVHLAIALPENGEREWVLPILWGDQKSPDACLLVFFQQAGNDLAYIEALDLNKDAAKVFVERSAGWMSKGVWYTAEELAEAKESFDKGRLELPKSDSADMNELLIDTAVHMNEQIYEEMQSGDFKNYIDSDEFAERIRNQSGKEEIEDIREAIASIDTGIISSECPGYYDLLFGMSEARVNLCALPENWDEVVGQNERIYVSLGSLDSGYLASVMFSKVDNQALLAEYSLSALHGSLLNLYDPSNEYRYNEWDEYAGIKNLDVVGAEATAPYYDYVLCRGGGYSIVAKQEESVTDTIEYVGVLDDDFNWVVPLSDKTYINPRNKKITDEWSSVNNDFDSRCNDVSRMLAYAGGDMFVYGQSHGVQVIGKGVIHKSVGIGISPDEEWPDEEGYPKIFHAATNEWVDITVDYESWDSIYFTDGYYVAANMDSWSDWGDGKYVLIINSETGARETNIYCGSYDYIGEYSEGLFFSYDGFYNIDCEKVIDLSEYAGLIYNRPYFFGGRCELYAENENGTIYRAVIDSDGNFMEEFEEVE